VEIEEERVFEGYMRVNTEKRKVIMCQVSRCQAGNSKKNIHVVFADRVLVAVLLCALRVTDGFIKGAVASQVD